MKRLLLSIHDVAPCFESQVDELADLLAGLVGGPRFAMLVVPDYWERSALRAAPAFQARLRAWADSGVEMFVHGWTHKDAASHRGAAAAKARHMTGGEGEFLGLDHAEAARRMREGAALIADITGRAPAGFIAPAWLYGEGAMRALGEEGFALAEDHMKVWRPATGEVVAKGPVITWASRSRWRIASSLAVAAVARAALPRRPWMRLAVHPGDTNVPALTDSIARTVASLSRGARFARYSELLPAMGA